jgi:hypothetical protein
MVRWLIIISWVFSLRVAMAHVEEPTFVIESDRFSLPQKNDYQIGNFGQPLTQAQLTEIMRSRQYQKVPNFEVQYKQYYYFVYVVENRSNRVQQVYLRFPLWVLASEAWLWDGQLHRMERYPRWGDIYYIDIPPGVYHFVGMRLSGAQQTGRGRGVKVLDFASLEDEWRAPELALSMVFGAVVAMIFYNFAMFLTYRRVFFIYYMIYSASALFALAVLHGYIQYHMPLLSLVGLIGSCALIQFCNSSLDLKRRFPGIHKASSFCALLCVILSSYSIVTGNWLGFSFSAPVVMSFCFVASIYSLRGGYQPALYFVIGWGVFLTSCSLLFLNVALLNLPYLSFAAVVGFAAEISLFSFAIGQEARLSEKSALSINEHAFNQLKKVFYPHQIDRIKNGVEIERTMPTGRAEASVISFDIVESSKIQQPLAKAFIEDCIKSCVSIISENYDAERMQANGYRIKEVGDGFLCSVGYPFQTPQNRPSAIGAVELGLRFIQIFQEKVDQWHSHAPVYCSIGIAFDMLEGYFPKEGTIEYDVYGRALLLATRYESLRHMLFPEGLRGHILTIQEKIYKELPLQLQSDFHELDLYRAQLSVRDDLQATRLYYRILTATELRASAPPGARIAV